MMWAENIQDAESLLKMRSYLENNVQSQDQCKSNQSRLIRGGNVGDGSETMNNNNKKIRKVYNSTHKNQSESDNLDDLLNDHKRSAMIRK